MARTPSEIATYGTGMLAVYCLLAPYDNYNEGQKILIRHYTYLDVDVQVDVDKYWVSGLGFVFTSNVTRNYIDISGYVEEAFGSLYDDVQEICREFASDAFNIYEVGSSEDIVEDIIDQWNDAYEEAARRVAVFS